jgi:hypothetical protein
VFDVTKNKMARGYILKILNIGQPQPVGSNVIDICLIQMGMPMTETLLTAQLQYLADKDYIEIREAGEKELGNPVRLITLKAKGVDLLEGSIAADPGIIIPRE